MKIKNLKLKICGLEQGFIKLTKRGLIMMLIVLIVIGTPAIYLLFNAKTSYAAWYDDNWAYRKTITLTDTAAETNKYATLSAYNASSTTLYQSDCGDVRFTDVSGKLLPYTVSSCGASTTFHINITSILNGTQTIYIYYGNPSAANGFSSADLYTACATCTFGTPASEEKGPGPAAYWSFDDGTGTTAQDATTNNNDGTISGATWQTEDMCISGKCLKFDGTDDRVNAGNNSSLQITTSFTLAVWVKPISSSANGWFISKVDATNNDRGYGISQHTDSYYRVTISDNGTNITYRSSGSSVQTNTWTYVVAVYNSSSQSLDIYINGQLNNGTLSGTIPASINNSSTSVLLGARSNPTPDEYFNGFLDEPKVYPYARSSAQILADYNSRGGILGTSAQIGSSDQWKSLSQGLVGYWKMDEASWTVNCSTGSVLDSSGNGNNGKACPNSTGPSGGAAGKFGNGGLFDGTNDYVSIVDNSTLNLSSSVTVSAWVKPDNTTPADNYATIIRKADTAPIDSGYMLHYDATNPYPRFCVYTSSAVCVSASSSSLTSGQWWHVVGTYDGKTVSIYVNGSLMNTNTTSGSITTDTGVLDIGGSSIAGDGDNFDGTIDEARIYNRALSATEVSQLYNFAPGPRVELKMEEGNGTSANDTSGNGRTGTINGNPTWSTGKYGKGIKMDGTGDNVQITDF